MQTGPQPPSSLAQESGHSSLEKLRRLEAVTQRLLLLHLTCYFVPPHSPKEGISGILSVLRRLEEGGDHALSQDISPGWGSERRADGGRWIVWQTSERLGSWDGPSKACRVQMQRKEAWHCPGQHGTAGFGPCSRLTSPRNLLQSSSACPVAYPSHLSPPQPGNLFLTLAAINTIGE